VQPPIDAGFSAQKLADQQLNIIAWIDSVAAQKPIETTDPAERTCTPTCPGVDSVDADLRLRNH
jgi:hypothetical protein